jgi:hypothetical protein
MVERVSEVIYDYLDERFPDGAFPGGVQVFADDHLDAEFKHEAGCDELAERIIAAVPSAGGVEGIERWKTADLRDDLRAALGGGQQGDASSAGGGPQNG